MTAFDHTSELSKKPLAFQGASTHAQAELDRRFKP